MNQRTLCKVYVTCGFTDRDDNRGTDEFIMDVLYQNGQHLYQLVKSELVRRNPSMKMSTFMDYYLIDQEQVTLTKQPFKVNQE
ncbi:MAG: hypothetical protein JXR12_05840 [Neptunomonas phycophila]|uniref:hypothetical protein n=1 Tax=Neptunomonas phycophila TaxID=1572645 RepID=UPI003B8B1528